MTQKMSPPGIKVSNMLLGKSRGASPRMNEVGWAKVDMTLCC